MARGTYRFVPRPVGIEHQHPYLVFDRQDRLHFHLTVFAKEAMAQLSEGTVRTYLYAILPFFNFLDTDPWQQRAACRWDAAPDERIASPGIFLDAIGKTPVRSISLASLQQ